MKLSGARVLVTGASGYVGRHVLLTLIDRGAVPVPYGRHAMPDGVIGDIRDLASLEAAMNDVAAVIHLAAFPAYMAELDARSAADINVMGTLNVLVAARTRPGTRVLFASSAHVYGPGRGTVTEDAPLRPTTVYGAGKADAEGHVATFQRTHGVATTVLRFPTLYGIPVEGLPPPNVIEIFAVRATAGEPLVLHGRPSRPLDLLGVAEAAEAIVLALAEPSTVANTYNVGGAKPISLLDAARAVLSAGASGSAVTVDTSTPVAVLPILDARKAERAFGFRAMTDQRSAIVRFVRWRNARER